MRSDISRRRRWRKFSLSKRLKASPCITCEFAGGKLYDCHQLCEAYKHWAEEYKKHYMECKERQNELEREQED